MSTVVTSRSLLLEAKPRAHPEDDLQRGVVRFLKLALPGDAFYFHIPNGGPRHGKARAILTGMGLRAGVPDLCVIHRGHAHFIELKAPGGYPSAVQRQVMRRLIYCGADVCACRSVPDVEAALRSAGVPLRATVS